MVFSGGGVVGLGRLDFVIEYPDIYFLAVVSQGSYPFTSLFVPVDTFVFRCAFAGVGFVVYGVLLVGDYSEIFLSIVFAIVIDVVDYHAFGRVHNFSVHVNDVKAVFEANGVLSVFESHKVPVVFT